MSFDPEWLELPGALVGFQEDYVPEHQQVYNDLVESLDWSRPVVRLFGRESPVPRQVAFQGDPGVSYGYSGQRHQAEGWSPPVERLRECLQGDLGQRFNSVLINWYRDGNDCMGMHSDDERELGPQPLIASISLGAPRRFVLRRRDGKNNYEIMLRGGSLLIMGGDTQRCWRHALPRQRRVRAGRINLTFRQVVC